jgi:hypothetical protein
MSFITLLGIKIGSFISGIHGKRRMVSIASLSIKEAILSSHQKMSDSMVHIHNVFDKKTRPTGSLNPLPT